MSEENMEIVRRVVDAWNRRDLDELLAVVDPGVEYVNRPEAVEPGTRRGPAEVSAVWRAQWDILDGRLEADRFFDRGDEIVVLGRLSASMPQSEAQIEERSLLSWKLRDGKITRFEVLGFGALEVQTALEAAGLSE
jgi:ketosteroid isomerase-like protein